MEVHVDVRSLRGEGPRGQGAQRLAPLHGIEGVQQIGVHASSDTWIMAFTTPSRYLHNGARPPEVQRRAPLLVVEAVGDDVHVDMVVADVPDHHVGQAGLFQPPRGTD
jgi:hypothetical protein